MTPTVRVAEGSSDDTIFSPVCVCVCVKKRKTETERETETKKRRTKERKGEREGDRESISQCAIAKEGIVFILSGLALDRQYA